MKKLLISVVGLLVVLVAAVLVVPSFIDWNSQKSRLTSLVETATGRKLTIDGDMTLALVPTPALAVNSVRFANHEGGSEPSMIELETLKVRVALLPLLQGRVQFESVSLVRPRILLEVLADGRRNWLFADGARSPDGASPQASGAQTAPGSPTDMPPGAGPNDAGGEVFPGDLRFDSFTIEDGTLVYRNAEKGREERIEKINGNVIAESIRGPFALNGTARVRDVATEFDMSLGRVVEAGATRFKGRVALPEDGGRAELAGTVSLHPDTTAFRGKLEVEGDNLLAIVVAGTDAEAGSMPAFLANGFAGSAEVDGDLDQITVSPLLFRLGDTSFEGEATAQLEEVPVVRARLGANKLDLDELLARAKPAAQPIGSSDRIEAPSGDDPQASEDTAPAGETPSVGSQSTGSQSAGSQSAGSQSAGSQSAGSQSAGSQSAAEAGARDADAGAGFPKLPQKLDVELQLSTEAIVYRGQVVRQARFEGRLTDGRAEIHKAMALLPGGSDISLTGRIRNGDQGPQFEGHVETASDNVRAVLQWLGADLSMVSQDRLRRMALSGDIVANTQQVTLQNLDLKLDVSRILGGAVVALRDRPGMGIGLSVDRIDLDGYLGGADTAARGQAEGGAQETGQESGQESGGDAASSDDDQAAGRDEVARSETGGQAGTAASPGGLLDSFDANLDLRIASLTFRGNTAESIRLDGTLQSGALTFKDASIGNLGGNSARYTGTLTGLGGSPTLEGSLELRVAKPKRLAKLVGIEQSTMEAVGPFNLNGNLKASLAQAAVNARVAALDGQFGLRGTFQPLAVPLAFDLVVEADHNDLAALANRLSGRRILGAGLGGLDASARITGTTNSIRLADLSGRVGPTNLRGGLVAAVSGGRLDLRSVDLEVAAQHGNLAELLAALDLASPVSRALGGIDLSAKVTGTASDLRVTGLDGRVGPIDLAGALSANLANAGPALTNVDLRVGVEHGNLAELLDSLAIPSPITPALGGIDLSGKVSGTQSDLRLSDLGGHIGPMALSGSLSGDFSRQAPVIGGIDLDVDIRHPNLAQLTAALGRPGTVSPSFGGIDLRARVVGSPEQLELRNLDGRLGPGDLRGTAAADLRGAKPEVTLDLTTGPLPVAALLAPSGGSGGQSGSGLGGSLSPRWSTRPMDLSWLAAVNANVSLESAALLYDGYELKNAVVRAVLRDSQLDLKRFSGTIYNGAVQVGGRITAGNQLDVGLAVNAIEIEVGQLLRGKGELERVSGPLTINASLTTRGASEAELVSRLNGEGDLSGVLTIRARAEEALGAALLGLLGDEIREIRGLADTTNTLLNAFAGAPAPVRGSFRVSGGQIQTRDLRLDGRDAHALTAGAADLPSWQISSRTDVYRRGDTQEEPYLTAYMTGPLDSPNPRVEGGLLRRRSAPQQAPQQGPADDGGSGGVPRSIEDLKDIKPEDVIKDLLKGFN